jgi:hypothetical protein
MPSRTCKDSRESVQQFQSHPTLRKLRKIIEVFALEPVRRPAARSFSEEGEILCESLVRTLARLNQDLEGLIRATTALRPYFGAAVGGLQAQVSAGGSEVVLGGGVGLAVAGELQGRAAEGEHRSRLGPGLIRLI